MQLLLHRDPDPAGLTYWSVELPRYGELGVVAPLLASAEMYGIVITPS